jgi:RNA polymerase sigma factor (sigma-70 family)
MSGRPIRLNHVCQLAREAATAALPDAELLRRFASTGDESAFAALAGRHGALVWAARSTVLGHQQDAEDAFQATFLVLAQRPRSVRQENSLASWVYGVARRIAWKLRTAAARQRTREQRHAASPPEEPASVAALRELQAILHEEVERLPAKYRAPFVLCCLEGQGRQEAARRWVGRRGPCRPA